MMSSCPGWTPHRGIRLRLEGKRNEILPFQLRRAVFVITTLFEFASEGSTKADHRLTGGSIGSAGDVPADGP